VVVPLDILVNAHLPVLRSRAAPGAPSERAS
jgi:hypothetical protein